MKKKQQQHPSIGDKYDSVLGSGKPFWRTRWRSLAAIAWPLLAFGALFGCPQVQDVGASGSADASGGASGGALDGATSTASAGSGAANDGGSPISCENGYVACAGACRDLENDPDHCGACGRSCLGEACGAGKCPVTTLLNENQANFCEPAAFLVADDQFLFWTNAPIYGYPGSGDVCRVNFNGTASFTLSSSSDYPADGRVAVDSTYVYWASSTSESSGQITRAPRLGGAPSALVTLPAMRPNGVALDAASSLLFVAEHGGAKDPAASPSTVGVISTNGAFAGMKKIGEVVTMFIEGIAVDKAHVYVTARDSGFLVRLPRQGGAAEVLATGFTAPIAVKVDSTNAYVLDAGLDWPPQPGSVTRVPLDGGPAVLLAADLLYPFDLAIDEENVYFTARGSDAEQFRDGAVFRVSKQGGGVITLADAEVHPVGIALHGDYVYWVNRGSAFDPSELVRTAR